MEFEPTPLRTGALSQRLRPLGQTVMLTKHPSKGINLETEMTRRIAGSGSICPQLSIGASNMPAAQPYNLHTRARDMSARHFRTGWGSMSVLIDINQNTSRVFTGLGLCLWEPDSGLALWFKKPFSGLYLWFQGPFSGLGFWDF